MSDVSEWGERWERRIRCQLKRREGKLAVGEASVCVCSQCLTDWSQWQLADDTEVGSKGQVDQTWCTPGRRRWWWWRGDQPLFVQLTTFYFGNGVIQSVLLLGIYHFNFTCIATRTAVWMGSVPSLVVLFLSAFFLFSFAFFWPTLAKVSLSFLATFLCCAVKLINHRWSCSECSFGEKEKLPFFESFFFLFSAIEPTENLFVYLTIL